MGRRPPVHAAEPGDRCVAHQRKHVRVGSGHVMTTTLLLPLLLACTGKAPDTHGDSTTFDSDSDADSDGDTDSDTDTASDLASYVDVADRTSLHPRVCARGPWPTHGFARGASSRVCARGPWPTQWGLDFAFQKSDGPEFRGTGGRAPSGRIDSLRMSKSRRCSINDRSPGDASALGDALGEI